MKRILLTVFGVVAVLSFIIVACALSFFSIQEESADSVCKAEVAKWQAAGSWLHVSDLPTSLVDAVLMKQAPEFSKNSRQFTRANSFVEIIHELRGQAPSRDGAFRRFAARLCLEERLAKARSLNHSLLEFALANEMTGQEFDPVLEIVINRAHFANGMRGIKAASESLFPGQPLTKLTIEDQTKLAEAMERP